MIRRATHDGEALRDDRIAHGHAVIGRRRSAIPTSLGRSALARRLAMFVMERFPPHAYGPLIVTLVVGGTAAASLAMGERLLLTWRTIGTILAVLSAFLQLRILDELRDEGIDGVGRPQRPLPRGLVTRGELRAFALGAALIGLLLAVALGVVAVAAYAAALIPIWMFGLDLPRRFAIRHGILRYALLHSIVVPLLILFVWVTVAGPSGGGTLVALLLIVWAAGLAMELARKTFRPHEERAGVETYSAQLGRPHAVMLTAIALSVACAGAGFLSITLGAPVENVVVPFVVAGTIPAVALRYGPRIGTAVLQSAASVMVLGLLAWPLVIALRVP